MHDHKHIVRVWQEWEFDDESRVGVAVYETNLQTNPREPGYDEDKIRELIEWICETEKSTSLGSAHRFRLVPKRGSDA